MTQSPLPYQSQPTGARRWISRLIRVLTPIANHLIALAVTALLLTLLPLIVFTLFFLVLLLLSFATTSNDSGGLLFFPAGLLLISIIGLTATFAICILNIIFECVRKPLDWPAWSSPLLFCALAWIVTLITVIIQQQSLFSIAITPITFSLGLTFFFCLYWFPLTISETITDWLRRKFSKP